VSAAPVTPIDANRIERCVRRRPAAPVTPATSLDAAHDEFATHGNDRGTIRGIAAVAGVDAALVLHYFGCRAQLFEDAIAIPMEPAEILWGSVAADVEGIRATAVRPRLPQRWPCRVS
jgi:AcrR family transcriptional regulator